MSPGRELDLLIAEKFFNLKIRDRFTGEEAPLNHKDALNMLTEFAERFAQIPYYSTDIAAAWQVVEKLKDSKKAWGFKLEQSQGEVLEWNAYFGPTGDFWSESESAPHAICLAALKAVEGK